MCIRTHMHTKEEFPAERNCITGKMYSLGGMVVEKALDITFCLAACGRLSSSRIPL